MTTFQIIAILSRLVYLLTIFTIILIELFEQDVNFTAHVSEIGHLNMLIGNRLTYLSPFRHLKELLFRNFFAISLIIFKLLL